MNVDWSLILICALVTWRVGRFIEKDALIDGTRAKVLGWLDKPRTNRTTDFHADKVWTLLTCPWCLCIWISAGALLASRLFVVDSVPVPIWSWLAVAVLPLVPWNYLDGED